MVDCDDDHDFRVYVHVSLFHCANANVPAYDRAYDDFRRAFCDGDGSLSAFCGGGDVLSASCDGDDVSSASYGGDDDGGIDAQYSDDAPVTG